MAGLILGVLLMAPADDAAGGAAKKARRLPSAETFFDPGPSLEMLRAVEVNDARRLRELVTAGADPAAVGRHNMTALKWALRFGAVDCQNALLAWDVSPEVRLRDCKNLYPLRNGKSALSGSALISDRVFYAVLQNVQNPHAHGDGDRPMFPYFCHPLHPDKPNRLRALLERGADPNCLQRFDPLAADYVLHAGKSGPELATILLNHGADPNVWNEAGNTQLIDQVYRKHSKYIEFEVDIPPPLQQLIDTLAEQGSTLEMAAQRRTFMLTAYKGLKPNDGSSVNIEHYLVALRKQAQLAAATPEEAEEAARLIAEGIGVDLDEAQRAARLFVEQPLEVKLEFLHGREAEVRRIADLRAEIYLTAWRAERGLPPRVARPGEDPVPTGDPDALERSPDAFWRQPLTWIEKYGGQPDE